MIFMLLKIFTFNAKNRNNRNFFKEFSFNYYNLKRRYSMKKTKKFILILILLAIIPMFMFSETINGDEIIKKINEGKEVMIENFDIRGDIDFRKIKDFTLKKKINGIFKSEKEYTYHIKVPVILKNCRIYGKVIGYFYDDYTKTLYKTNFYEIVEFKGTIFYSEVYFKYTEFFKDSDFSKSVFKSEALFKYAKFDGNSNFSSNKFENEANFKYAKFKNILVDFKKSKFFREANFKYTKFNYKADFSDSYFSRVANFKFASFFDLAIFKASTFEGEPNFKYCKFNEYADFSNSKFKKEANFKYTKFYNGLSFENTIFEKGANFKYTKFTSPFNKKGIRINGEINLKYAQFNGKSLNCYFFTQNN